MIKAKRREERTEQDGREATAFQTTDSSCLATKVPRVDSKLDLPCSPRSGRPSNTRSERNKESGGVGITKRMALG